MRWYLMFALVLVLAILVGGIVKVATRERGSLVSVARTSASIDIPAGEGAGDGDGAIARPSPPASPAPLPARLPPVDRRATGPGIAMLHGRVRFGRLEDHVGGALVQVVASDRTRTIAASADADGRFSLHLPPGMYQLTASLGPWIGVRPEILARAGVDRAVDLDLREGATIAGRTRGAEDASVTLTAVPTGERRGEVGAPWVDEGAFTVDGLIPGRRYDLTFRGERIRTVEVAAVLAPAEHLDVVLTPLAVVRGAIGFARGATCPIDEVRLVALSAGASAGTGQTDNDTVAPDGACAFELPVPDGVTQATVVATGGGWRLEEPVAIPSTGEPEPLCLNPPCAPASELVANVRVELEGAPSGSGITAQLNPSHEICISSAGACEFERRPIGALLDVSASGGHCRTDHQSIVVARGENVVRLRCRTVRVETPIAHAAGALGPAGDWTGGVAEDGVEDGVEDGLEDGLGVGEAGGVAIE